MIWHWLGGSTPSGVPNWLALPIGVVTGGFILAVLISAKVDQWRNPPMRRGFLAAIEAGEVIARRRRGEISDEQAYEELCVVRFGAFSPQHLQAMARRSDVKT